MKIDWLKTNLIACLLVALIGCNPVSNPTVPEDMTPSS